MVLAIVVLAMLALAAPASASTLARDGSVLVYTAAPGELNEVGVFIENGEWVVRDRVTIQLAPGSGCTNAFGEEARCGSSVQGLRAALADGDDVLTSQPLPGLDIDGGDGNDNINASSPALEESPVPPTGIVLRGGSGTDQLTGNGTLDGGDGDDILKGDGTLLGGAGSDQLEGGGTLDGGDGDDSLKGTAQPPNGNDTLRGGTGNDRLEGYGTLDGGDGNDRLKGAGTLLGGPGDDVLDGRGLSRFVGGPGRDIIRSQTVGSTIDCAGGGDDLVDTAPNDKHVGCGSGTTARIAPARVRLRRFLRQGSIVNVTCASPCAVYWTLLPGDRRTQRGVRTGGGHLSRGGPRSQRVLELDASLPVYSAGRQAIRIRALGRATKKALGRMRRITVLFRADIVDRRGVRRTVRKKFRIRR